MASRRSSQLKYRNRLERRRKGRERARERMQRIKDHDDLMKIKRVISGEIDNGYTRRTVDALNEATRKHLEANSKLLVDSLFKSEPVLKSLKGLAETVALDNRELE